MTRDWMSSGPPPELLAAYADGALAGAEHERVANWLADHPEARAVVAELRRLQDLVERTQPQEPEPASWADVLDRVHAALMPPAAPTPRRRWRPGPYLGGAAAALVVMGLTRVLWGEWTATPNSDALVRISDLESRLGSVEGRAVSAERRAAEAERRAADASHRADEATCWAQQAEERAGEAELRAEASAVDMAATPHLDLLTHEQVRLLNPSSTIRTDDWATPMIVDPVLSGRVP